MCPNVIYKKKQQKQKPNKKRAKSSERDSLQKDKR